MGYGWILLFIIGALIAAGFLLARRRRARRHALRTRALAEFVSRAPSLEEDFLVAASATGKPRGLRWKACQLQGAPKFAADRANDELYALMSATVSFEAIEGGPMEDVEAVGNLRAATAVFVHRDGKWTTDGRVVFNLDPAEALNHYRESLAPVEAGSDAADRR